MTDEREAERHELVARTILRRGVHDPHVLRAMRAVPRHRFVPPEVAREAYRDRPLSIGFGQTISQPYIVALMAELAGVEPGSQVLDVGTGSGYQAAVLREIGADVVSVERLPDLADRARATLHETGYGDVKVVMGDGKLGWPEDAPYDAILVSAAAEHVPDALITELAPGGRLVVPVGTEHQELLVIEKSEWGSVRRRSVTEVAFVPLR